MNMKSGEEVKGGLGGGAGGATQNTEVVKLDAPISIGFLILLDAMADTSTSPSQ